MLNTNFLFRSFNKIVCRHEILRTNFKKVKEEYIQIVRPSADLVIPVLDLSDLSTNERETEFQNVISIETQKNSI